MTERHTVLGGKVHVYKRPNSSSWQCSTFMGGRNRRRTTKEDMSTPEQKYINRPEKNALVWPGWFEFRQEEREGDFPPRPFEELPGVRATI